MSSPESAAASPTSPASPRSDDGLFSDAEEGDNGSPAPVERPRKLRRIEIARFPSSHETTKTFFARVPGFLGVQAEPFTAEAFLAQKHGASKLDIDENVVRWKYARSSTGNMTQQSNARIVEWEDGSRTLQLGSEHFELPSKKPYDPTFITVAHQSQNVLKTHHVVDEILTVIPSSLASESHKRLASALARRISSQQVQIGTVATIEDPEKLQRDLVKAEQMKDKARRKLDAQRATQSEREYSASYSGGPRREVAPEDRFADDEDDEDVEADEMESADELEVDEEENEEADGGGLDSDDLDALEDEAEEANMSRLQAIKSSKVSGKSVAGDSTGDDEEKTDDERPVRRVRVLDDDDSE